MGHPNKGRGARQSSAKRAVELIRRDIAQGFSFEVPGLEFRARGGRSDDRLHTSGGATLTVAGVELSIDITVGVPEPFVPSREELPNGDCILNILPGVAFRGSVRHSDAVIQKCELPIEPAL
jgi:hypothetical protein